MADNDHDYEFKAEYAKSGRAGCKACKENIAKDSLRLAIMVQSPMFDGKVPNWFHFTCFWKRARVLAETDVDGFGGLRWADQKKIKEKITGGDGVVPGVPTTDFSVEYAKSNRSTCRGCEEKITKDEVRLGKKDFDGIKAKMYGPQDLWHHIDCFVEKRADLGFAPSVSPTEIVGFSKLKAEDQELLFEKLGKGDGKKRKAVSAGGDQSKKAKTVETADEKSLREQSQQIWKIRDALQRDVSMDALRGLLEYNDQDIPSGENRLLDRVSDCMIFGALQPCKECGGQLAYSGAGYRCTGDQTEWTKCIEVTKTPRRRAFKIPKEYHDVTCLKKYKYVECTRIFPAVSEASASAASSGDEGKPLTGLKVAVVGKTKISRGEITRAIVELGGKVVTKIDKNVTAIISTKAEVEKMSKMIAEAKTADVRVVDEDILTAMKTLSADAKGLVDLLKTHSISLWGADPPVAPSGRGDAVDGVTMKSVAHKSHAQKSAARIEKEEKMFTKSVPSTMKLTVKGGAAIDPDSGLEKKAHMAQDGKDPFNAVLGKVDVIRGTNSYYKLQLLEADSKQKWWVFRSWGRVGTSIGKNKLEKYNTRSEAVRGFHALYEDKTGNEWSDRYDLVKMPNKFYPLDIDYGGDEEIKNLDASAGSRSKLPASVQQLVRMVFDVETMKKAMLEYEIDLRKMPLGKLSKKQIRDAYGILNEVFWIDLKKMPLGKLSKKQIRDAYAVLNEVQQLLEGDGSATRILDASNRFYTLIPHDFGMKKIPLLDNIDIVKTKTDMLDNLLDIEIAYSLLKTGEGDDKTKDPLDVHYDKLKTEIQPMDKSSEDYQRLVDYVKNTHAATHDMYTLDVEEIFTASRQGEAKRYRPFRDLHNRQLLWHGSRVSNMAGILSQGLRIAPPEAPVTGYMFGKGIYFADMVSKSANYCYTSRSHSVGLLLLCEVALGNMYELTGAEYVNKLPKGKHSTKGCGMTEPDASGVYTTSNGVTIPMGQGSTNTTQQKSSLLYNEYIVYDVAQVNIKHVLKVNFKYKW